MRPPAILVITALIGGGDAHAADWPRAGGPSLNFKSDDTGLVTELPPDRANVLWRTQVGPSFAGLTAAAGSVFTVSITDGFKLAKNTSNGRGAVFRADNATDAEIAIYRLDAKTGSCVWVHRYRVPAKFPAWHWSKEINSNAGAWYGPKAEPTVDGDWLYALDHSGVLTCLAVRDGAVRWSVGLRERFQAVPPKFGYSCPPLVVGDKVIVPLFQDDGCLAAVNKQTGEVIWRGGSTVKREQDKHRWDGYSLPVTLTQGGSTQLVYFTGAGVIGLDIETGAVLWTYPIETFTGEVAPRPIVDGNRVFISSVYFNPGGLLLEVGKDGAKRVWESRDLKNHFANLVLQKGFLYGTTGYDFEEKRKPVLRCLEFTSGTLKWTAPEYREQPNAPPQQAQLIAAGDKLVILTGFGDLIVADASPEQYHEISRVRLKAEDPNCQWWPRMALANRRLYCRTTAGEVQCVALDGTKRKEPAPLLFAEKGKMEAPAKPESLPAATEASPAGVRSAQVSAPCNDIERNWANFRGPYGNANAFTPDTPTDWDAATGKGIAWKTPLPRAGHSSPIVWGNRLFLTVGDKSGAEVLAFDKVTGAPLWTAAVKPADGAKELSLFDDGMYAASTPATDGERVCALFPDGRLVCLSATDGAIIWSKSIGTPDNQYGQASSLLIHGGCLLLQKADSDKPALMGIDVKTGGVGWKTELDSVAWTSPVCVNTGKRWELLVATSLSLYSFDPETGNQHWVKSGLLSAEVAASPAWGAGQSFVANDGAVAAGLRDGAVLWECSDYLPDTASPLAAGGYLFIATANGDVACLDQATGKQAWVQEFGAAFQASPIWAGARVYALDQKGAMHIFGAAPQYEKLGGGSVGEPCSATPAFSGGRIYIRGAKHLFCVTR